MYDAVCVAGCMGEYDNVYVYVYYERRGGARGEIQRHLLLLYHWCQLDPSIPSSRRRHDVVRLAADPSAQCLDCRCRTFQPIDSDTKHNRLKTFYSLIPIIYCRDILNRRERQNESSTLPFACRPLWQCTSTTINVRVRVTKLASYDSWSRKNALS